MSPIDEGLYSLVSSDFEVFILHSHSDTVQHANDNDMLAITDTVDVMYSTAISVS